MWCQNLQILLALRLASARTYATSGRILAAPVSPEQILKELGVAVVAGDGEAVFHLTEELRAAVPRVPAKEIDMTGLASMPQKPLGVLSVAYVTDGNASVPSPRKTLRSRQGPGAEQHAPADVDDSSQEDVPALHPTEVDASPEEDDPEEDDPALAPEEVDASSQAPAAIFDDHLFRLSAKGKAELRQELQNPAIAKALQYVQNGGWYNCGYQGATCKCVGHVRYGHAESNRWSKAKMVVGQTTCSHNFFADPAPGDPKECQCHRASASLMKRENSVSLLQEAFIFLLRFLAMTKMLPFTGDRRDGRGLWSARHGGGPPERFWIRKYMYDAQQFSPGGTCMDWDGTYLNKMFPKCTKKYVFKYEPAPSKQRVVGQTIYGDVYTFQKMIGPSLKFNLVISTQVFEHLHNPYGAAQQLFQVIAPGGALLYTAPQTAHYHQVPGDFLRYTKEEVIFLFESAGFCVPANLMVGSGDFIFDVARNVGLQVQDFTQYELDLGYQQGLQNIADGAITIHAMAYKPPHAYCKHSTKLR